MNPDELEELGFTEEPPEPRMQRTRRIIMGEGGSDEGAHVEMGHMVDADAPLEDAPPDKAPATGPTPQQREWWEERETERELAGSSLAEDVAGTAMGLIPGAQRATQVDSLGSASRLGRRGLAAAEEWLGNTAEAARGAFGDTPLLEHIVGAIPEDVGSRAPDRQTAGRDRRTEAPVAGVADAGALGWADELGGMAMSTATGGDYETERDRIRGATEDAAQQAPGSYAIGQAGGMLPWMLAPNPATGLGRIGLGALMGGADAAGHSEATGSELASDAGLGALLGGGLGAAGELGLTVARGPGEGVVRQRALAEMSDAADDSLLAATGHAGHNRGAVEAFDFGDSREQIRESRRRAAEVLRSTGAVPRFGGIRGTRRSIEDARRGAVSTMDDVRTAMGSSGPRGTEVAERLAQQSSEITSPAGAQVRDVLDDFAARYGGEAARIPEAPQPIPGMRDPNEPIDYNALVEDLGYLRDSGSWRTRAGRDVPLGEQGRRRIDRTLRGAYDDAIEQQAARASEEGGAFRSVDLTPEQREALARLGPDPRGRYRDARRQYAVLDTALENAQRGEAATAGNRLIGMSEMLWGNAGATAGMMGSGPTAGALGALGGLGLAAGARAFRAAEPRLRATGNRALLELAQSMPELTQGQLGAARRALGAGRVGAGESADEVVLHESDDTAPQAPANTIPDELLEELEFEEETAQ